VSLPINSELQQIMRNNNSSSKEFIPEPFLEVAQGMEKQFAEFMVQEMQKTIGDSDVSTGMDYYKSLLSSEYADALSKNENGLGIQDLILNQIYPKNMRSELAYNHYKQQQAQSLGNKPSFIRLDEDNLSQEEIKIHINNALGTKGE
jgi:Rod binding domain-containing protein